MGQKFASPFAILFLDDLKQKILNVFEEKPMIWGKFCSLEAWRKISGKISQQIKQFLSGNKVCC